jgi:hypothetical protein
MLFHTVPVFRSNLSDCVHGQKNFFKIRITNILLIKVTKAAVVDPGLDPRRLDLFRYRIRCGLDFVSPGRIKMSHRNDISMLWKLFVAIKINDTHFFN